VTICFLSEHSVVRLVHDSLEVNFGYIWKVVSTKFNALNADMNGILDGENKPFPFLCSEFQVSLDRFNILVAGTI